MRLTIPVLRQTYALLAATDVFQSWNLPDADDVKFSVVRDRSCYGWHKLDKGVHHIAISAGCVSTLRVLTETMAHEMVHVHENSVGAAGAGEHSKAFRKWGARVARDLGFDPAAF